MQHTAKLIAAGVTSVALFGGIGAGIAYADPAPAPSSTSTAAPQSDPTKVKKKAKKDRVLHAELFFQRGTVAEVSDSSITVRSADDFVGTYVVNEKSRVVVGAKGERRPGTIGDVKAGDRVRLVAVKDGDTLTARRIADRGPK